MAEYIDREKVFALFEHCCECEYANQVCYSIDEEQVFSVPLADVIEIPKGATNGDIIKALFKTEILFVSEKFNVITVRYDNHSKNYDLDWWNAPYRKE